MHHGVMSAIVIQRAYPIPFAARFVTSASPLHAEHAKPAFLAAGITADEIRETTQAGTIYTVGNRDERHLSGWNQW
jgi:alkylhydroperoxidase/carboxymuconolactone decarboxylase family protein YurZ